MTTINITFTFFTFSYNLMADFYDYNIIRSPVLVDSPDYLDCEQSLLLWNINTKKWTWSTSDEWWSRNLQAAGAPATEKRQTAIVAYNISDAWCSGDWSFLLVSLWSDVSYLSLYCEFAYFVCKTILQWRSRFLHAFNRLQLCAWMCS